MDVGPDALKLGRPSNRRRLGMKAIIIIIVELVLLTAAQAKQQQIILQQYLRVLTIYDKDGSHWQILAPPMHWFQQPGPKNITIKFVHDDEIRDYCEGLNEIIKGTTNKIAGCAVKYADRPDDCDIYIEESLTAESKKNVIYHEEAHCHGWPPYHPTTEPLPIPRPNPIKSGR